MICLSKKVGRLSEDFIDYNLKDTKKWFNKHLIYAEMEADRYFVDNEIKKKRLIWNKLPLFFRPFLLLFYRLILKMSFLDGLYAIQYHLYHDLVYRMIIDIKILKKILLRK